MVDADEIQRFAGKLGVQLSDEDAIALAHSPMMLPDVLPAVVASASLEEIETQGDAVSYLLDECENYLTMRFRASSDGSVTGLLPLAVPSTLTAGDPGARRPGDRRPHAARPRRAVAHHDPRGRIGPVASEGGARYRMEPMLRRVFILELKLRDPALARRLSSSLGEHFRERGEVFESIAHFSDAEDWDAVIETLDSEMFRLLAEDPLRVHDAILALPRKVRDDNPRFTLCLEVGWQPREGLAQAYLTIARRAAGIFARLPREMSPWDLLHVLLIKTIVFRLKGDFASAIESAHALDQLLDGDDDIAGRPIGTLAEAHYQSGMSRLLGLDLVGARESFTRSFTLTQNRGEATETLAERAAEATALVRALEGETDHAATWLASSVRRRSAPPASSPMPSSRWASSIRATPGTGSRRSPTRAPTTSCGRSPSTPPTATASTGATRSRPTAPWTAPGPSTASSSSPDRPLRCSSPATPPTWRCCSGSCREPRRPSTGYRVATPGSPSRAPGSRCSAGTRSTRSCSSSRVSAAGARSGTGSSTSRSCAPPRNSLSAARTTPPHPFSAR